MTIHRAGSARLSMFKHALMAGALSLLMSTAAHATLIGDNVDLTYAGFLNGSASTTVAAVTPEFFCPGGPAFCGSAILLDGESVNIEASSISFTWATGYFAPQTITLSNVDAPITGFSLTTGVSWLTPSDITFTDHSITLDVGTGLSEGGFAEITLEQAQVPEPTTLALFLASLAGGAIARNRKANTRS